jgi:hypothetical protein
MMNLKQEEEFEDFIKDLTDKDQPEECQIDDPDCDNCGS